MQEGKIMLISTIRLNSDYYKKNKQKDIRKELEKAANNKINNNDNIIISDSQKNTIDNKQHQLDKEISNYFG